MKHTWTARRSSDRSSHSSTAPRYGQLVDLRRELFAWLSTQPRWQQDLARRLAVQSELTSEQQSEILRAVKEICSGAERLTEPEPLEINEIPDSNSAEKPRLLSFGRLRGVGLVSSDSELTFASEGMTLIYGANAAGKSSYVKALKRLGRSVNCDTEVLGNVYESVENSATPPKASVTYQTEGKTRSCEVELSSTQSVGLDSISVFDSACAELYVDSTNTISFVPSGLKLLTRMATAQDQMRNNIQIEIRRCNEGLPCFDDIPADTDTGRQLGNISANTSMEEVRACAALNEDQTRRLQELRALVAAVASQNVKQDAASARRDATAAESLDQEIQALLTRLDPENVSALMQVATARAEARQVADAAATTFSELPVAGVGAEAWRILWGAARQFVERQGRTFPPSENEHCPLCVQPVTDGVAARMLDFESHVNAKANETLRISEDNLAATLDGYDTRHVDICRTGMLEWLAVGEQGLHQELTQLLEVIAATFTALRADPEAEIPALPVECLARLRRWGQQRDQHARELLEAADPQREQSLQRELVELAARERLAVRFEDVRSAIASHKKIAVLRRSMTALATNKITTLQRELSHQIVSDSMTARLDTEIQALGLDGVGVNLRSMTHVGQTQIELRLVGATETVKIKEVASEGERRALALAFFFAELAVSETVGGIVLDDPVSSLDDERREHIARRLIQESDQRQVVVFTHDLPFMLDLVSQYKESRGTDPEVRHVWRNGRVVGHVDTQPPFVAMKLDQQIGHLTARVDTWDKCPQGDSFNAEWSHVCFFYVDMRKAWECAVEERLFKGVVRRFQREVKTLALKSLSITDDMLARIKAGMDRCSHFAHDQPPTSPGYLPSRAEIEKDLAKLREFSKMTRH